MFKRIVLLCALYCVFMGLISLLPLFLDARWIPVNLLPCLIVYSIFFLTPIEGCILILLLGGILDLITSDRVGVWMAIATITWVSMLSLSNLIGKMGFLVLGVISTLASFLMYVFAWLGWTFFTDYSGNTNLGSLLLGAIGDGLLGIVFFRFVYPILVICRVAEPMTDALERLQERRYV